MTDFAIRVENVGKRYNLGIANGSGGRSRYKSLRDSIANLASWSPLTPKKLESFWALKDICFDIKQGEVVGIIGRNGAGKSTLLKILSRITEPTTGSLQVRGRVASLLEVGTGFHPELTGRENILLNGAILGMSRKEISRKFDDIVAFAEVERFLDTPVKRFSSGMYVRLAFAVAAHLEPEILIVDEVLAVGDAEFQKRCLGKMQDVSKAGRTVLFVSHNIAVIQALCPKAILLESGTVAFFGNSALAAGQYLGAANKNTLLERRPSIDGTPTITKFQMTSVECQRETVIDFNLEITTRIRKHCSIEVKVFDELGMPIGFASVGLLSGADIVEILEGSNNFKCQVRMPRMAHGLYRVSAAIASPMIEVLDSVGEGLYIDIHPTPLAGYGRVMESNWGCGPFEIPLKIERRADQVAQGQRFEMAGS